MDAQTFLQQLIKRYKDNMIESSASISTMQTPQSPIQLRVCNTLKYWIENYWFDFEEKSLLDKLLEFVEFMRTNNEKLANVVRVPLNRKINGQDAKDSVIPDKKVNQPRPKPLIPKIIVSERSKRPSNSTSDASLVNLNQVQKDRPSSITNWGINFKLRVSEERGEDIKLKLTDFEPLETARQLTLVEFELFTAIKVSSTS
jgi:hypothetical protein